MTVEALPPLAPEEATRLTEFARAFKAAARAVVLYPDAHPAIAATLGRIVQSTSAGVLRAPLRIGVTADSLSLEGRSLSRPEPAVSELAALLHAHLIGELTVHPGGTLDSWRSFLRLIGRSPEEVRAEGGIGRLWATTAGGHVELREIDYAEVLREREEGLEASWKEVIANCLQGDRDLDPEVVQELLALSGDPDKLGELVASLETAAVEQGRGMGARTAAVVRLLRTIVDAVKQRDPDRIEPTLRNVASAVGRLSPDMMVALLGARGAPEATGGGEPGATGGGQLVDEVVSHMPDAAIAGFVARNALAGDGSIDRVAQAFHSLVRDTDQRDRLLALAHDDAAASPLGSLEGFEEVWGQVAEKILTTYRDKPFVSEDYARELNNARTKAIDIEQAASDPPERVSAWLGSVATTELRRLDLTLVLDLLRIEKDPDRWSKLMRPTVALIEDLLLVGDFGGAADLVESLAREASSGEDADRRQAALIGIDVLVAGPMMRHIIGHLTTVDDAQFAQIRAICLSLGEVLIRPLAEALASEARALPRERLTAILIGFGSIGRREVERLKNSPNPAVRRTAIYLLREFGGSEALPQLTELLGDDEPQVQREAVRAILNVGTDDAYQVLERALTSGTERSRELIMQSLGAVRDERATPLLAYILQHVDHRGPLNSIYLRTIEAIGGLKDPVGIPALKGALYRGEWWAPRRTAILRTAAAAALARIGTSDALAVLEEAIESGPRGVRAAARAQLPRARTSQGAAR